LDGLALEATLGHHPVSPCLDCSHTDVPKKTLETKLKTADAARIKKLKNGYS
jgi:hypothetical protein